MMRNHFRTQNDLKQYWCETSENFLQKWPKTGIFTYFGAENGPKIEPLRPIVYTHLKVVTMTCETVPMWNHLKLFEKMTKDHNFRPIWGPKIWALEAHIVHISRSSSNEHIKQDWCESMLGGSRGYNKLIEGNYSRYFLWQTHVQTFSRWTDGCCVGIHHRTGTTFCK